MGGKGESDLGEGLVQRQNGSHLSFPQKRTTKQNTQLVLNPCLLFLQKIVSRGTSLWCHPVLFSFIFCIHFLSLPRKSHISETSLGPQKLLNRGEEEMTPIIAPHSPWGQGKPGLAPLNRNHSSLKTRIELILIITNIYQILIMWQALC